MEPLKAEPQEMFGGSNTDPHQVFGCLGLLFPFFAVMFHVLGRKCAVAFATQLAKEPKLFDAPDWAMLHLQSYTSIN